jgi:hypothetical protein
MGGGGSKMSMWHLLQAVENNEVYQCIEILKGGCDPNLSHAGVTPLQMAIECGTVDIAALLLHWKANPNAPTSSRARGAGWRTGESAVMICNRYIKQNKPHEQGLVESAKQVWFYSNLKRNKNSGFGERNIGVD